MNKQYTDAVMKLGEPTKKTVTSSFCLRYKCKMTTRENKSVKIFVIILQPEKFLQFDWLRADVFSAQFETPTCKNYSYYGNPKSPNNVVARIYVKNGGKILKIRRIKN